MRTHGSPAAPTSPVAATTVTWWAASSSKGPPNVSTRDVNWFGGGQSGRARAILLDRPSSSERGATPSACRCDGYRPRPRWQVRSGRDDGDEPQHRDQGHA